MSRRFRHLIENQPNIKVIAQAHDATDDKLWFTTLVIFLAGVFYFFGYYFGSDLWRVLAGG